MQQAAVDEVVVRASRYSTCPDVIESDHKPVWAILELDVPVTDQQKKRRMCSHILKAFAAKGQARGRPALHLMPSAVQLKQVCGFVEWSEKHCSPGPGLASVVPPLIAAFGVIYDCLGAYL